MVAGRLPLPDVRRCRRAVQSLASDHARLASDPPLLSVSEITNWDTRPEVLGWIVDAGALKVTLPRHKRRQLRTPRGGASFSGFSFHGAGVTARPFPHTRLFRCSCRVVFRTAHGGLGEDTEHRRRC